ncbi:MAG: glycoside hydrolase family 13 protein [Oscillospiraceae bacterium]|jgi:glycosidase|nr:glycoside hydrolase family 13 protein [Oscillospiraceae bacterium]
MFFDSRDLRHKSPFGAVPAGTPVSFRLTPPRAWQVGAVRLHVIDEFGGRKFVVEAERDGIEADCDAFSCVLDTKGLLGPVWYYFSYEMGGGQPGGFIGPASGLSGGVGTRYESEPPSYQLTVYKQSSVPDWYGRGITYHIFPDRFCRSVIPNPAGMVGSRRVHRRWGDCPDYLPDSGGEIKNRDFFGGNLLGVIEKLDYLDKLGVKTIYFSPVFEAASNHRYDTADYMSVDPMLGTEGDFTALCKAAAERGIRVLLDGVFNHTGFDSVYFNGRGTYPELGAYQSKESKYFDWFDFQEWPERYSSWWGVYTLPQINENNPDYLDYIIRSDKSVIRKWIRLGASGWRLDVADELPDSFIEELRAAVREELADGMVIGEVWEDASNKISYGVRRRYFLGGELDGVMNYPFRDAAISFVLGGSSAQFAERMEALREHYPRENYYSLMNSLGTHDTPRILTVLGASPGDWNMTKTMKSISVLTPEQRRLAVSRLKVAAAIMFAFPGSPTVYYGDEAGLEGYEDPFNRRGYPWGREDKELLGWYAALARIRNESEALQSGDILYIPTEHEILCFKRVSEGEEMLCLFNRGGEAREVNLQSAFPLRDMLAGGSYGVRDGVCRITLPPYGVLYAARAAESE